MLTSRVSIGSEDISWGSRKNPFIEIPFPDDWHWIFLPSCSVSVKAVYSSFAIWNRAHGHLLISLHPTCFCVQPRLNAERSQYKWRFQSIYLSVQPRLNARDRCKSDFILSVDIFREARRGLSDKYLLRSQRVSPIIYWAKIIQYNPHSISTDPLYLVGITNYKMADCVSVNGDGRWEATLLFFWTPILFADCKEIVICPNFQFRGISQIGQTSYFSSQNYCG